MLLSEREMTPLLI